MRAAAEPDSCTIATSRCSVETNSSLRRSASCCARWNTAFRRAPRYWPALPPRTFGSFATSASISRRTASTGAPTRARIGPTTPSCCCTSVSSRCSGSIAWCSRSSASDCAVWTASRALTVNLSNLTMVPSPSSAEIRARVVRSERAQLLVQLFFFRCHLRRQHDAYPHELIAVAAGLDPRHAVARQAERPSARRRRRDLHGHAPAQRRHFDRGAERCLRRRDRQIHPQIVTL